MSKVEPGSVTRTSYRWSEKTTVQCFDMSFVVDRPAARQEAEQLKNQAVARSFEADKITVVMFIE